MKYEDKIQRELDKHSRQWCDAVCPNVAKFGRQADKEIAKLKDAASVALGHLTGGMDGDWRDCDPAELLRKVLSS